jgi:hypothetical protein
MACCPETPHCQQRGNFESYLDARISSWKDAQFWQAVPQSIAGITDALLYMT